MTDTQWMPIETLVAATGWAAFGYWTRTGERKSWNVYARQATDAPSAATHWQPLPEPPKG